MASTYDVVIAGGGPAGATCAAFLVRGGARVLVVDRARFPRVKLCAGWVSVPIWDELELRPGDYRAAGGGLWEWNRCHVHYRDASYTIRARGYFIRRYQLDEFLLRRSGAELDEGVAVGGVAFDRGAGEWVVTAGGRELRARHVIGAGGTNCPVARAVFAPRPNAPVGVQEHEFPVPPADVAATRAGEDGEPELLLHADLRGYSWNVPKTGWLNVGTGTADARAVREAWTGARAFFEGRGRVPASAAGGLDHMKGHSYYLFDPAHLRDCERDGALLCGDARSYAGRLARHPVLADYAVLHRARELGAAARRRGNGHAPAPPRWLGALTGRALAHGFAWMFSGKPLPLGRALHRFVVGRSTQEVTR